MTRTESSRRHRSTPGSAAKVLTNIMTAKCTLCFVFSVVAASLVVLSSSSASTVSIGNVDAFVAPSSLLSSRNFQVDHSRWTSSSTSSSSLALLPCQRRRQQQQQRQQSKNDGTGIRMTTRATSFDSSDGSEFGDGGGVFSGKLTRQRQHSTTRYALFQRHSSSLPSKDGIAVMPSESSPSLTSLGRFTNRIRSFCTALPKQRHRRLSNLFGTLMKTRSWVKRTVAALVLLMILFLPSDAVWAAGSSGRMGGSIGGSRSHSHSSRPSMSRSTQHYGHHQRHHNSPSQYSGPRIRTYGPQRAPPIRVYHHYHHGHATQQQQGQQLEEKVLVTNPDGTVTVVRKQTTSTPVPVPISAAIPTVAMLVGVGVPLAYWMSHEDNFKDGGGYDDSSPLGPGASAASLTVCLLVPKRTSSGSDSHFADMTDDNNKSRSSSSKDILSSLEHLAETADTSTRKGLQKIIEETSVELLRQKDSIVSVDSQYQHFRSNPTIQSERQYRQWSTTQRVKFERETLSNYGGTTKKTKPPINKKNHVDADVESGHDAVVKSISGKSTVAIVHITVAIEGDSLKETFGNDGNGKKKITTRRGLIDALTQLSSDVQVDDCLLSAEVIWSPQDPNDQLTMEDVYGDFPSLYSLLD